MSNFSGDVQEYTIYESTTDEKKLNDTSKQYEGFSKQSDGEASIPVTSGQNLNTADADIDLEQKMARFAGLPPTVAIEEHEQDFDDSGEETTEVTTTERPVYRNPMVKGLAVSSTLLGVLLVVGASLTGVFGNVSTEMAKETGNTENARNPQNQTASPDESSQDLPVKVALGTQEHELAKLNERDEALKNKPFEPRQIKPPEDSVRSVDQIPQPAAPVRVTSNYRPRSSYQPSSYRPTVSQRPVSTASAPVNAIPFPTQSSTPPSRSVEPTADPIEEPEIVAASYGDLPVGGQTQNVSDVVNAEGQAQEGQFQPVLVSNGSSANSSRGYEDVDPIIEQQRAFLAGETITKVDPGATAAGRIETNAILSDQATQFLVQLTSPVINRDGSIAIAEGERLVMQTDGNLPDGIVQASAVALMTDSKQIPLPQGALQVASSSGKPLKARSSRAKGFGSFAKNFLVGALNQGAGLLTQNNQSVVSSNNGLLVANEKPNINVGTVGAALVQGGTQRTLGDIQESLQDDQQSSTPVYLLSAGKKVEIQVTQPVSITQ